MNLIRGVVEGEGFDRPVRAGLVCGTRQRSFDMILSINMVYRYDTTIRYDHTVLPPNLVPRSDHFSPHVKNWSGERPIPFSFPAVAKIVT